MFERLRKAGHTLAGAMGKRADPSDEAMRLVDEGISIEQNGRLDDAMQRYEAAIRLDPSLARAHLCRGNILLELGDLDGAVEAYSTALAHNPDYAAAHYNLGNAYVRSNRREAAQAAYRKAIALKSDFADAEVALGALLEDLGQAEEAIASYRRALEIKPDYLEVYRNLGNALNALGKREDTLACYRRALEINPDFVLAHFWLGDTLRDLGQHDEALASYRRLLTIKPDLVEARNNLANILKGLGRRDEAIASYREALLINPDSADVLSNLGVVLHEAGQFQDAVASLRRALELTPDAAIVHYNLGNALQDMGQVHDAVSHYRRALEIDPNLSDGHANLGSALYRLGQLHDAIASYRQALRLDPDHLSTNNNLGVAQKDLGQLDVAAASFRRALEINPDYAIAQGNLLFLHNFLADQPADMLLAEARRYGEVVRRQARPYTSWANIADPTRTLRVGLVSGDLVSHPVGYFAEGPLAALASQAFGRVDLYAYPTNFFSDAVTERIKVSCRGWSSALGLSDEQFAQRIREDRIDILIDLSGHTANNRLPVFAWRPAPVQASWLGYFATTGVGAIDYLIADPWTLPASEEVNFTETIWRLPETRLCFTPPDEDVEVGLLSALANGFVTFGCFNHPTKMNDDVVALWARVLTAVPHSRLFLKAKLLQEASVRQRIIERFAAHGIDEGRLILEHAAPRAEYLAAYRRVDIALDPFPYPGGTTTVEALWMGVPVLTLAGERFLSRQGVGLLMNAGLPEWVAVNPDDYVGRAVSHANDLRRLASLRQGLRDRVLTSPLFDAPRFANHLEVGLRRMWQKWCDQRQK